MQRIEVDLISLVSEPVDVLKVGDEHTPLQEGEHFIAFDEELEVEAVAHYDPDLRYWFGTLAGPIRHPKRDQVAAQQDGSNRP